MREESFTEFVNALAKKSCKRKTTIKNAWGIKKIWKTVRKHKWYNIGKTVPEGDFYAIIRTVNLIFAEDLKQGKEFKLPCRMGKLELRKREVGVTLKDGKLVNTYPIDWVETHKLWYEDEEARRKKILVRNETECLYWIKYNKYLANYKNQTYYQFVLNRRIKVALKENILAGKVDALW